MTLHAPQVHGFFSVPVDHLHALRELAEHFSGRDLSNTVVVSPDLGNAKSAAALARMLGLPVAAGAKERHQRPQGHHHLDHRRGRGPGRDRRWTTRSPAAPRSWSCCRCCASAAPGRCGSPARTGCSATARWSGSPPGPRSGDRLHQHRPGPASTVSVGTGPGRHRDPRQSAEALASCSPAAPDQAGASRPRPLHVISVAPALAEAIRRIHEGESVSALFDAELAARAGRRPPRPRPGCAS